MRKIFGRTLAILLVAGALVTMTNYAVTSGATGSRFGGDREEHERRERDVNPNSLSIRYPAIGVAAGLMPTVFKIIGLGIVTVQVGSVLKRRRR